MVICRLMGGMGNQMYSYALGRALSLLKKSPVYVDKSWLDEMGGQRNLDLYALSCFRLQCLEWRPPGLLRRRKADRILSIVSDLLPKRKRFLLTEKACRYDSWVLEIDCRTIYIRSGTWQSYKYFERFEREIRDDFRFDDAVYRENRAFANRILADDKSVSIHVRRGDYVANSEYAYTQGICTDRYYARAMDYFRQLLGSPTFYFFSDDMAYVQKVFGQDENHVFLNTRESTGKEVGFRSDGHHDMYLMSLCRHNIVANSTFSWWGAFLNKNAGKQVVAPGKWYADVEDDSFIVPQEWIRIAG